VQSCLLKTVNYAMIFSSALWCELDGKRGEGAQQLQQVPNAHQQHKSTKAMAKVEVVVEGMDGKWRGKVERTRAKELRRLPTFQQLSSTGGCRRKRKVAGRQRKRQRSKSRTTSVVVSCFNSLAAPTPLHSTLSSPLSFSLSLFSNHSCWDRAGDCHGNVLSIYAKATATSSFKFCP